MSENTKRRLAFACCAAMAFAFTACGDDGDSVGKTGDQGVKCGDKVCTETQECVDGTCKEKGAGPEDPCAKCGENQTCEDGVCKDKPEDPCAKCGADQTCEDGVCKDKPIEDPCPVCTDGKICDPSTKTCIDPPEDPCSLCTDKQECINLVCVDIDPCANKTCPDNTRCDREKDGACVDIDPCEGVTCGDAQTCIKARCIDDACIENGAERNCGDGKTCSKGECVDDGCQNKTCDEGWQCIKGLCEETACIDYFCDEGRTCKGGACVDNECLDMACDEGKVCSKGNCLFPACLDKEACPTGKACDEDGECMFIVDPAISLDEPEDKTTDESGKTNSLTLHLNNAPSAEVRVSCEVITESQNKEVDAACEEIVFNADNWQIEQTILLTGVDDYVKDGDQAYKIKVTTASEDIDFNELVAESVELTNIDTTKPGFVFSETALTTYEDQESPAATFTVTLSSIPTSDVRLTVSTSNADEGKVSPTTLTFTKDNWGEPQTVTVQGQDDNVRDGNKNYTVFFAPSESNDEDYNGFQASPIKVTNIDNDVAGLNINIPAEDFEVLEGEHRAVLVKLNTQPKNEVNIAIAVDNKEAEFSESKITLNAENWNTGKEIYLTGVADYIIDGDKPAKLTFTASSEDEDYNLNPVEFNVNVKDVDTADLVAGMGDSPIVKEGSSDFVTMSLSLSSKPKKDVTVALSVTDNTELKLNKSSLKFTPEHWDMPQDVLVNSVDDDIVDGNIKSKVVMKMTSSDANFNDKTKEIEFTTVDDDVAGFLINSNAASFPEGSSSTTSLKVSLQSQPTADVTVTVSSTDASELAVTSATTLKFTTSNWKTPQDVTVKVVDDKIADGTQTAQVRFVAASTDTNFDKIEGLSAVYTITDDDAASVALSAKDLTIVQASPSTVATVVLGIQPASNVTVTLSSDHKAVTFSPSSLTFTTSNWNVGQNVTVKADFNALATASAVANISAKASGTGYNVTSNVVKLNLVKVPEVQNFAYTGNVQTSMLPAGKYKLEVWGAQGGGSQSYPGSKGGYSVGTVTLKSATTVYVFVGGQGETNTGSDWSMAKGGWNGGGAARMYNYAGGGGGGGTDISIVNSDVTLDGTNRYVRDNNSYLGRIIVAGGGGGSNGGSSSYSTATYGGGVQGGGNITYIGGQVVQRGNNNNSTQGSPGTQNVGGNAELYPDDYSYYSSNPTTSSSAGVFGIGSSYWSTHTNNTHAGGGGGGWYGGGSNCHGSGGGGSGYVYKSDTASYCPNGCKLNSNYYLENAQTIAGGSTFPAPGGGTETGHPGNGYARITLVK